MLKGFDKDVKWNVEVYGAGPARGHSVEGLPEREGQHICSCWLKAAFHIWAQYVYKFSLEVSPRLLERPPIPLRCGNVTRNCQERRRVHERGCNAYDEIRRTRTTGGEGRDRFLRD